MKKFYAFAVLVLIEVILIQSCTKPANTPVPDPPNPPDTSHIPKDTTPFVKADFTVEAACNASLFTDTLQKLFDPLLFINKSDEGKQVKYHWSFGDGTESDSINPTHAYVVAGTYAVQLVTYYDTIPKDTITRLLRIIIGLKDYNYDRFTYGITDADAAPDDGVLALVSSFEPGNIYNYSLLRTDSILNTLYLKQLPANVTRLNSLKKTKRGNYIISGSYDGSNTNQFALSLIDTLGNLLWQKVLNINGANYFTNETSDGGFITIGDELVDGGGSFITAAKCNSNGDLVWKQSFNTQQPLINNAHNIIETPNGYAFAAERTHDFSVFIKELVLTQLDFNGKVTGQDVYPLNWNSGIGAPAKIAAAGNTYMAFVPSMDSVLIFDNNFKLKVTKQIINSGINTIIGFNDNYYTAFGNGGGSVINTDDKGSEIWITNALKPVLCSSPDIFSVIQTSAIVKGKNDIVAAGYVNNLQTVQSGVFLMRISKSGAVR